MLCVKVRNLQMPKRDSSRRFICKFLYLDIVKLLHQYLLTILNINTTLSRIQYTAAHQIVINRWLLAFVSDYAANTCIVGANKGFLAIDDLTLQSLL